ncbi:hypothetical protein Syun_028710 [Stephania yunnanensis]|uniref:Pentatricopeptide repeat-containing protein n=1 Tax=Stephania yunnanensis TaxID=152371 RepID=A0AAP0E4B3_9MAGN
MKRSLIRQTHSAKSPPLAGIHGLRRRTTAGLHGGDDPRLGGGLQGRCFRGQQVRPLRGLSLPMSRPHHPRFNSRLSRSHRQVSPLLSLPISHTLLSNLQEQVRPSQVKLPPLISSRHLFRCSSNGNDLGAKLGGLGSGFSKLRGFGGVSRDGFDESQKLFFVTNGNLLGRKLGLGPGFSKLKSFSDECKQFFSLTNGVDLGAKLGVLGSGFSRLRGFSGIGSHQLFCLTNGNDWSAKLGGLGSGFSRLRSFSGVCSDQSEEENEEIEVGNGGSGVDWSEVERVCKVIEELFVSDRNMEGVLDQCGIEVSSNLVAGVLDRFRHARKPAFRFFNWAGQRPGFEHDSRTYNAMMRILGKTRQFESMVSMLEEMGKKKLLTIETFSIAIKGFASAREMKKAVGIFELMKKYDFKAGTDTFNDLLDALGRAKLAKEAQALFEKLKNRFTPDLQTYTVLLAGWCKVKNLMDAGRVWNEMIDRGFKPDIVAHNIMLEGLLKGRKSSEAIKLFELMKAKGPSPNVRSYTILIRDLCKGNKMEQAVEYFDEMVEAGCKADPAVYTCLIAGFGNQKKMDKVYGLLKEMKEQGCPPDGRCYNALIKLMTNRQMPDDAVRLYKKMVESGHQPTIHTYNMMMKSYFHTKNYEMGRAVWEEMNKKGCCPDDNSYTVFISGLIRHGRAEEACKYIEEMIEKGMKAPQLDYNKFAADFSRAGKPDILHELALKMKFSGKFEISNMFASWSEMMKK